MLISAMVGIDSRATMDIDTTLRNYPLNCESAEQIVRQIADVEIDDKISFVIKKTEEIMEDSEYQGVRLSLDAYLDKTRIPLKIDISTGDVITAVSQNPDAIGYASLASIKDTVKALNVDGVTPGEATVKDGSYKVQRPFVLVTVDGKALSPAAQAFFDYATSSDAASIIAKAGAVAVAG